MTFDSDSFLWDVFDGWYRPVRLNGKPVWKQYRYAMNKLERFLERRARVSDLNDATVAALLAWLSATHKPRTVNNCRKYLLAFWRWLNRRGVILFGPDVPEVEEPEDLPKAFTVEQIRRLIEAGERRTGTVCGIPESLYWPGLARSIFSTGERIGAVRQWDVSMLDVATGELAVPAHVRKGKRAWKVYSLQPRAQEALAKIVAYGNRLLFPWEWCDDLLYRRFDRLALEAGLPRGREWKFHAIRKSHASYLALEQGEAAAQESLGHTSRVHTRRYLDPRIVGHRKFSACLPEI